MFTSNLLRIFGMHAMLVRCIIHFILLLCSDCVIYIIKYKANYEFYNCLNNRKFTFSAYLQIVSQHSFFMSFHSGKHALLQYFWKANTKRILNTDKTVGETNLHSTESTCWICPGLLLCCFSQSFISLLVWRLKVSLNGNTEWEKLKATVYPPLASWFRTPSHALDHWHRDCLQPSSLPLWEASPPYYVWFSVNLPNRDIHPLFVFF